MEATCRCQASRSLPMTLLTLGCVCNSVGLTQAARGPEPSARARTAFLPTFAAPRAGMPQLRRCGYVSQAGRGQETARGVLGMWARQGYGGTFSLLQRARLHPLHSRGMRTRAKPGPLHMSSAEREIAAAAVDEMLLESSMADACNAPQSTGRSSRQQEGAAGPSFSDSVETHTTGRSAAGGTHVGRERASPTEEGTGRISSACDTFGGQRAVVCAPGSGDDGLCAILGASMRWWRQPWRVQAPHAHRQGLV